MPIRHYMCQLVELKPGTLISACGIVIPGLGFDMEDGRVTDSGPGWSLVSSNVTDQQHALLDADARILTIPIEDAAGAALAMDATVADIPSAKRTTLQTRCENNHIPTSDFGLATPVREILKRVSRRFYLRRRWLMVLDYTEALNATVGSIASTRRTNIRNALIAAGYSVAGITNATTIEAALIGILSQSVPANQTKYESWP